MYTADLVEEYKITFENAKEQLVDSVGIEQFNRYYSTIKEKVYELIKYSINRGKVSMTIDISELLDIIKALTKLINTQADMLIECLLSDLMLEDISIILNKELGTVEICGWCAVANQENKRLIGLNKLFFESIREHKRYENAVVYTASAVISNIYSDIHDNMCSSELIVDRDYIAGALLRYVGDVSYYPLRDFEELYKYIMNILLIDGYTSKLIDIRPSFMDKGFEYTKAILVYTKDRRQYD
jgi:hypothetical protein